MLSELLMMPFVKHVLMAVGVCIPDVSAWSTNDGRAMLLPSILV